MRRIPMRRTAPMLLALLMSTSIMAEPQFTGSTPADGASLGSAPEEITLEFAQPVVLTAVIVHHESDGASHAIQDIPRERAAELVVPAPELEPGSYRIEWRALDDTIHVTSGDFGFEIR